jgi:hypothetical protein
MYAASNVCILAFVAGPATTLLGFFVPHCGSMVCFPLSNPEDVIADEQGRIYVTLGFYSRVQVYDHNGRFLHGFFTDTGGGSFRLQIDSDGLLNVVTARGDRLHVYDECGNLCSSKRIEGDTYTQLSRAHSGGFVDNAGNRYGVKNRLLNPQILRLDRHRNVTLRIRTPIVLWPLIGPIPCWLVVLIIALVGAVLRYWKENHRSVEGCVGLFPGGTIRRRDVLLRHYSIKRDIILTDLGVCWAPNVWEPYACIPHPDLVIRVERRGVFKFKQTLILQSLSQPTLSIRFSPRKFEKWRVILKVPG